MRFSSRCYDFFSHYIGDFTGDGKEDLWVFNGTDWSIAYLGMLRSTGTALAMQKRYDGNMPSWQMRKNDRHYVAAHHPPQRYYDPSPRYYDEYAAQNHGYRPPTFHWGWFGAHHRARRTTRHRLDGHTIDWQVRHGE